jgi:hypothetical protein
LPQSCTRSVSVEEFIPVDRVETMLASAEALFRLLKNHHSEAAVNLKRSMVWMIKYIAPTSEFWDWPTVEAHVGDQTELRVKFIGHGWVIALVRTFADTDYVEPTETERELDNFLDKITMHISVEAVARLKSTAWTHNDIRTVSRYLRHRGYRVRARPAQGQSSAGEIRINVFDGETVTIPRISRTTDAKVRKLLGDIKKWANDKQRFEGADWCSYKRRRLTVIVRTAAPGTETQAMTPDDVSLLDLDPELHTLRDPEAFDIIEFESASGRLRFGSVAFPRYGYHLGVLHPRAIVRVLDPIPTDTASDFFHYLS